MFFFARDFNKEQEHNINFSSSFHKFYARLSMLLRFCFQRRFFIRFCPVMLFGLFISNEKQTQSFNFRISREFICTKHILKSEETLSVARFHAGHLKIFPNDPNNCSCPSEKSTRTCLLNTLLMESNDSARRMDLLTTIHAIKSLMNELHSFRP